MQSTSIETIKHLHIVRISIPIGLFAYYFQALHYIYNCGSIETPVVLDFRGSTSYGDSQVSHTNNLWEYYFEQPYGISMELAEQLINKGIPHTVHTAHAEHMYGIDSYGHCYKKSTELINITRNIVASYIQIRPEIYQKARDFFDSVSKDKKIFCMNKRGTQHYKSGHARGQAYKLPYTLYFDKVEEKFKEGYTHVLLITDEACSVAAFKERFGDKLIHRDEAFVSPNESDVLDIYPRTGRYKLGEDAIIDALLLSMCEHAVLTSSNLAIAGITFNKEITYEFIDDHISYH